jgi:hypothetical protein
MMTRKPAKQRAGKAPAPELASPEPPDDGGLKRLAYDISDAMVSCAAAFEAERQRRRAEKGNAAA